MARLSLRSRLYLGLAAISLTIASVAIVAYATGANWADVWLPNVIVEWCSLVVAVVVIERLLARHQKQEQLRRYGGLRALTANDLLSATLPILDYVVQTSSRETLAKLHENIGDVNYSPPLDEYLAEWKQQPWPPNAGEVFEGGAAVAENVLSAFAEWERRYAGVLQVDEQELFAWTRHYLEGVLSEFERTEREERSKAYVPPWHTLAHILQSIRRCCGSLLHDDERDTLIGIWEAVIWRARTVTRASTLPAIGTAVVYEEAGAGEPKRWPARVRDHEGDGSATHVLLELEDGSLRRPAHSDSIVGCA
jgi:hypothetical protein